MTSSTPHHRHRNVTPLQILPRTAAAFSPRAAPTIVLDTKVDSWLTAAMKRSSKVKRPLNNVSQHSRCLADILGRSAALWSLTSLMLPRTADAAACRDSHHEMLHLEGYVVHVDTVSQNEVVFKLTADTIAALTTYHKETYCINVASFTPPWYEKDVQIELLHAAFVNAVNRYVFRTDIHALEGLEDDGAGELLGGRSNQVKSAVMNLFLPLEQPVEPLDIVALSAAQDMLPSNDLPYWAVDHQAHSAASLPMSLSPEPRHTLPCTPSPSPPNLAQNTPDFPCYDWPLSAPITIGEELQAHGSPTPSLSQSIYSQADPSIYSSPYASQALPFTGYNITPTSHCELFPPEHTQDYNCDYTMMYMPQSAVSI